MPKFKRRPEYVEAVEWVPGLLPDLVYTDPKKLVGLWWAHMGHQRELDGTCGIVLVGGHDVFVHPGDYIVLDTDGCARAVMTHEEFTRQFEPAEGESD